MPGCTNYSRLTLGCQLTVILDGRGEIQDIPGYAEWRSFEESAGLAKAYHVSTTLVAVDHLSKICGLFLGYNYIPIASMYGIFAYIYHKPTQRFHHFFTWCEVGINICNFTINSMDPLFRALVDVYEIFILMVGIVRRTRYSYSIHAKW